MEELVLTSVSSTTSASANTSGNSEVADSIASDTSIVSRMKHSIVSKRSTIVDGSDLVTWVMQEEFNDQKLLFKASTDVSMISGMYIILNAENMTVAKLCPLDIFGLSYCLKISNSSYRDDGEVLVTIDFDFNFIENRPVSFRITLEDPNKHNQVIDPSIHYLPSFRLPFLVDLESCFSFAEADNPMMSPVQQYDNSIVNPFSSTVSRIGNLGTDYSVTDGSASLEVSTLVTRVPIFNYEMGSYLNNFGSRARVSSNKNFILIHEWNGERDVSEDNRTVYMRFGKRSSKVEKYNLDYRLDPLISFGTALAVLTHKLFC
jgi:hypothetical protein